LRGLESRRCPECGRDFDPADPKSVYRKQKLRWVRPAARLACIGLFAATIWAGWRGYRAWRQRRFAETCQAIVDAGGNIAPADPMAPLRERDGLIVSMPDAVVDGNDIDRLKPYLSRLSGPCLSFERPTLGDALAHLRGLDNVRVLRASGWSDEDLSQLGGLKGLQMVDLSGDDITDAGAMCLARERALRLAFLVGSKVSALTATKLEAANPGLAVFLRSNAKPCTVSIDEMGRKGIERLDSSGRRLWFTPLEGAFPDSVVWNSAAVICRDNDWLYGLDVGTGAILWRLESSAASVALSGDVACLVQPPTSTTGIEAQELLLVLELMTGKQRASIPLPSDRENHNYFVRDSGEGFICEEDPQSNPPNPAFVIDRRGRVVFSAREPILAAVQIGSDWILLFSDRLQRQTPEGQIVWNANWIPAWPDRGQVIRVGSNMVAVGYTRRGSEYRVRRFNPASGAVKWNYTRRFTPSPFGSSLIASIEIRQSFLAVTYNDDGTIDADVLHAGTGNAVLRDRDPAEMQPDPRSEDERAQAVSREELRRRFRDRVLSAFPSAGR